MSASMSASMSVAKLDSHTRIFEESSLSQVDFTPQNKPKSKSKPAIQVNGVNYSITFESGELKMRQESSANNLVLVKYSPNAAPAIQRVDANAVFKKFKIEFFASALSELDFDESCDELKKDKTLLIQVLSMASDQRIKQILEKLCVNNDKKTIDLDSDELELKQFGCQDISSILTEEDLVEIAINNPDSANFITEEFKIATQNITDILFLATKELLKRGGCDNFLSRIKTEHLNALLAEDSFKDLLVENIEKQGLCCLVKISLEPSIWQKLENILGKECFTNEVALKIIPDNAYEHCKGINENSAWEEQSKLPINFTPTMAYLRLMPKAAYDELVPSLYVIAANKIIKGVESEFTEEIPLLKNVPKELKEKVFSALPTNSFDDVAHYSRLLRLSDDENDWRLATSVDTVNICDDLEKHLDSDSGKVLEVIQNGALLADSPDLSKITCPHLKVMMILSIPNHQDRITRILTQHLEQYLNAVSKHSQGISTIYFEEEFIDQLLKNEKVVIVIKDIVPKNITTLLALTKSPEHWATITEHCGYNTMRINATESKGRNVPLAIKNYKIALALLALVTKDNSSDICTQLVKGSALINHERITSETHSDFLEVLSLLPQEAYEAVIIHCMYFEIARQRNQNELSNEIPLLDSMPQEQRAIFLQRDSNCEVSNLKSLIKANKDIERISTKSEVFSEILSNFDESDITEMIDNIKPDNKWPLPFLQALVKNTSFINYVNELANRNPIATIKLILLLPEELRAHVQHPKITVLVACLATHKMAVHTDECRIWSYLKSSSQFTRELQLLEQPPNCANYLNLLFSFSETASVEVDIESICTALIALSQWKDANEISRKNIFERIPTHIVKLVLDNREALTIFATKFDRSTTELLWGKLSKVAFRDTEQLNFFVCRLISNKNIEVKKIVEIIKHNNIDIWDMDNIPLFGQSLLTRVQFEQQKSDSEMTSEKPECKKTFLNILNTDFNFPIYKNYEQLREQQFLSDETYTRLDENTAIVGGKEIYLNGEQQLQLTEKSYKKVNDTTIELGGETIRFDNKAQLQQLLNGHYTWLSDDSTIVIGGKPIVTFEVDSQLTQRLLALLPFAIAFEDDENDVVLTLLSIHPEMDAQSIIKASTKLGDLNVGFENALIKGIELYPEKAAKFIEKLNLQPSPSAQEEHGQVVESEINAQLKFKFYISACINAIKAQGNCTELAKNSLKFLCQEQYFEQAKILTGTILKLYPQAAIWFINSIEPPMLDEAVKALCLNAFEDASVSLNVFNSCLCELMLNNIASDRLPCDTFLEDQLSICSNSTPEWLANVPIEKVLILNWHFLDKLNEFTAAQLTIHTPTTMTTKTNRGMISKYLPVRTTDSSKVVTTTISLPLNEFQLKAVIPWVIVTSSINPSAARKYIQKLCVEDQVSVLTSPSWQKSHIDDIANLDNDKETPTAITRATKAQKMEWKNGGRLQLEQLATCPSVLVELVKNDLPLAESFLIKILTLYSEDNIEIHLDVILSIVKSILNKHQRSVELIVAIVNCTAVKLDDVIERKFQSKIPWNEVLLQAMPQCAIQRLVDGEIPFTTSKKNWNYRELQTKLVNNKTLPSLAKKGSALILFFSSLSPDDQCALYTELNLESKKLLTIELAKLNLDFNFSKETLLLKLIRDDNEFINASFTELLTNLEFIPALLDILLSEGSSSGDFIIIDDNTLTLEEGHSENIVIHQDNKEAFKKWLKQADKSQLFKLLKDNKLPGHINNLIFEDESIPELIFTDEIIDSIIQSDDETSLRLLLKPVKTSNIKMLFRKKILSLCLSSIQKFNDKPVAHINNPQPKNANLSLHQELLKALLSTSTENDIIACTAPCNLETKVIFIELLSKFEKIQVIRIINIEDTLPDDETLTKELFFRIVKLTEQGYLPIAKFIQFCEKESHKLIDFTKDAVFSKMLFKNDLFEHLPEEVIINVIKHSFDNLSTESEDNKFPSSLLTVNDDGEFQEGLLGYLEQPKMYRCIIKAAARDIQAYPDFIFKLLERANNDGYQPEVFDALKSSVSTEDMVSFCPYCQMELVKPFITANQQEFVSALIKIEHWSPKLEVWIKSKSVFSEVIKPYILDNPQEFVSAVNDKEPWSKELLELIKNEAVFPKLIEKLEPNESTFNFLIRLDELELNEAQEKLISKYLTTHAISFDGHLSDNPDKLKVIASRKRQFCCVFNFVFYRDNKLQFLNHHFVAFLISELIQQPDLSDFDENHIEKIVQERLQYLLKQATTEIVLKALGELKLDDIIQFIETDDCTLEVKHAKTEIVVKALDEMKLDDVVKFIETDDCTSEVKQKLENGESDYGFLKNLDQNKENTKTLLMLVKTQALNRSVVCRALSEQGEAILEATKDISEESKRVKSIASTLFIIYGGLTHDEQAKYIQSIKKVSNFVLEQKNKLQSAWDEKQLRSWDKFIKTFNPTET